MPLAARAAISSQLLPNEYPTDSRQAPKCQSVATPSSVGEYEPVGEKPLPFRRNAPTDE